ncbi:MAG TPA: hypothetical protein VKB80_01505 [Kofleriaceae bacterium]|nr:hypothetical protein [Kofleriaceae bacterium]
MSPRTPLHAAARPLIAVAIAAVLGAASAPARADEQVLATDTFQLSLSGYGELGFAFHDYGADQNRQGGALADRRLEFDTTRLVTELEGTLPAGIEVEAEVEFEHGGTGAEKEIEYDEFGEFETDVEKGGEVVVEELYVEKEFGRRFELKAGRFYVALGQLSYYFRPTDYLGTVRSEAETTALPAQWDEMGVSFLAYLPRVRLTAQVVNGLDSTGFSSQFWVASGHQGAFELTRASDLAAVGRVDVDATRHLELGASGYIGGSSRNRPKADLIQDCSDPDTGNVAPCRYVTGTVAIADVHGRWVGNGLRGQFWGMWGHLSHAAGISSRNNRLSNNLGVARTPVADEAVAVSAELGYDVAPLVGMNAAHKLEPFARFDYIDTMFDVSGGVFDNPRFERTIYGLGAAYTYKNAIVLKLDAGHRRFGSSELSSEDTVRATAGFVY